MSVRVKEAGITLALISAAVRETSVTSRVHMAAVGAVAGC